MFTSSGTKFFMFRPIASSLVHPQILSAAAFQNSTFLVSPSMVITASTFFSSSSTLDASRASSSFTCFSRSLSPFFIDFDFGLDFVSVNASCCSCSSSYSCSSSSAFSCASIITEDTISKASVQAFSSSLVHFDLRPCLSVASNALPTTG